MPHSRTVPSHTLLYPTSLTPTCMTDTISRPIRKITDEGVVEIPVSAWAEVKRVAEEEFNAIVSIHDHDAPGAYHGRPFVPFAHYLVEINIDGDLIDDFIDRVDPLIEDVIARHTQQSAVPAGM
jgi:hypothetical protein